MLLLHLLQWNCLISLKSLWAKNLEASFRSLVTPSLNCLPVTVVLLLRQQRRKKKIFIISEVSNVWNWTCGINRSRVALPIFTIVRVQVHKQYDSHLKVTSIYITYTMGVRYYRLHGMIHLYELWPRRCLSASFSYHLLFFCAPRKGHSTPHRNWMKGSALAVASGIVF